MDAERERERELRCCIDRCSSSSMHCLFVEYRWRQLGLEQFGFLFKRITRTHSCAAAAAIVVQCTVTLLDTHIISHSSSSFVSLELGIIPSICPGLAHTLTTHLLHTQYSLICKSHFSSLQRYDDVRRSPDRTLDIPWAPWYVLLTVHSTRPVHQHEPETTEPRADTVVL